jgi:methane/ammonia monooxygenase subunit C
MSDVAKTDKVAKAEHVALEKTGGLIRWRPFVLGFLAINLLFVLVRCYQQRFGFSAGLDSYSPEFRQSWTPLLWGEIPLEILFGFALVGYLIKTRSRQLYFLSLREEVARLVGLIQWLMLAVVAYYWAASFFAEQDAAWHLVVIRDTDFTPSHIIVFYLSFPIYFLMAFGAFLYARTRIPFFARGYSMAFLCINSSFMILPNVALNEWGHSFWFMDEIVSAPLHWGFVVFGWMILGMFGVVLQILGRLHVAVKADPRVLHHVVEDARR